MVIPIVTVLKRFHFLLDQKWLAVQIRLTSKPCIIFYGSIRICNVFFSFSLFRVRHHDDKQVVIRLQPCHPQPTLRLRREKDKLKPRYQQHLATCQFWRRRRRRRRRSGSATLFLFLLIYEKPKKPPFFALLYRLHFHPPPATPKPLTPPPPPRMLMWWSCEVERTKQRPRLTKQKKTI